jgi:streptomycin 6-kinase
MERSYPFLAQHSLDDLEYERRTRGEPDRAAAAVELLPAAEAAVTRLCETNKVSVLLHGDFIDKNLLLDGDRYVAADPIPRVGDPASDIGFFAHEHPPASGILTRARAIAQATGNDEGRSQRWAAVWTVCVTVSAWRDDQPVLERLISSREFADLLAD